MSRLAHAVVACLAGAGLAIYAATRVWSVTVTERPGLPELRDSTTGAAAQPWLIALALIALAGPGAMLATRGMVRRGLGVFVLLDGAGLALAAVAGRAGLDPGAAGAGATLWPAAVLVGAALVMVAGLGAARHGHRWPTMGARYERRPVPSAPAGSGRGTGPFPAAGPDGTPAPGVTPPPDVAENAEGGAPGGNEAVDNRTVWDALDRGDDLTAR